MTWHQKITWLYETIYRDDPTTGGFRGLGNDLGVTRLTVQYWYHWPDKVNPLTNKPVEPNYYNRIAIDELYAEKTK